jgi:hypothetical protein
MVCSVSFHQPASFPWHKLEGSVLLFTQCWSEHIGCHSVFDVLSGVPIAIGQFFFSSPKLSVSLWCPLSLRFNGCRELFSPGVYRPGRAASHSHPFTAKVRNWWTSTSTLPVCPHGVDTPSPLPGYLLKPFELRHKYKERETAVCTVEIPHKMYNKNTVCHAYSAICILNSIWTFNSQATEFLIQSATTQTNWTHYMF